MADHADDDGTNVFVYMGGLVPEHLSETITHIRVHKSVKIITRYAFRGCRNLVSIEMHDGVEIIEREAFHNCMFLGGIKLPGVRFIGEWAFRNCRALEDVEFGERLETIEGWAFSNSSLRSIKLPKVRVIEESVFNNCEKLTDVELLPHHHGQRIGSYLFQNCPSLRRITIPLNSAYANTVFYDCDKLTQVVLIGGIHKTISSLLLERWRNEMKDEICRINQILPNTGRFGKTSKIKEWIKTTIERICHYKAEHRKLLKEFTTLLELALWKVKLDEKEVVENTLEIQKTKKAKIDDDAARQELRITSGANIVIKNVLPFLVLE